MTLLSLSPKTDTPEIVACLEEALAMAKRGELTGVVILSNMVGQSHTNWAGKWDAPSALWAFEIWKAQVVEAAIRK